MMKIEMDMNFNPYQHGARRIEFRGAECSVAPAKGVGKVAGIADWLRAVHTLRQMQTQHFLNTIPHTIMVRIHLQGVCVCVCICGFQSL